MEPEPFQRTTRQRQILLEELRGVTCHPTAAELYDRVRSRIPHLSLATVYRNLELLARRGVVLKLEYAGGEARFDGNIEHHDHIRCLQCGRVEDLSGTPLDLTGGGHHDFHGYQVLGHRLEFFGMCPRCRKESPETNENPNTVPTQGDRNDA